MTVLFNFTAILKFQHYLYSLKTQSGKALNDYWINRQKNINLGFVNGFERQKERIESIETDFDMLWGNFTGKICPFLTVGILSYRQMLSIRILYTNFVYT